MIRSLRRDIKIHALGIILVCVIYNYIINHLVE